MTREEVLENYQKNIGIPSPMELEKLFEWLDKKQTPPEVVNEAIREAVMNNAKNMRYINKVLKNWESDGVLTLEDVEKRLDDHEAKKARQAQSQQKGTNVPAWSKPDYKAPSYSEILAELE